jgi:nicotinamidase-related amidase
MDRQPAQLAPSDPTPSRVTGVSAGEVDPETAPRFATSALVTIDLQQDFLSDRPYGVPGTTEVVPAVARLVGAFRAAGRPVVHVVRLYLPDGSNADRPRRSLLASGASVVLPGSPGSGLAPGLTPHAAPLDHERLLAGEPQELADRELVVYKPRWGAFYETPLHDLLGGWGVDTVVFAGCNLPNCPRASIIQASERDYRVVVVRDAISRTSEQGLGEVAGIGAHLMTTDDVAAQVTGASRS